MKYYNTLEPIGEFFKVVIPEFSEPKFEWIGNKAADIANRKYYDLEMDAFNKHLNSLPQAALTKINKKGFLENVEEGYEVYYVDGGWTKVSKETLEMYANIFKNNNSERRIILVEK